MLARTDHHLTTRCDKALHKKRSSLQEWQVLSMLSDNAGHSMSEIARFVLMPAPSLTKLVNQMASRQLVYRRADPSDRRRVLIFLSARGRAAHRRLRPTVNASMGGFDDQLLRDLAEELAWWIRPQGPQPGHFGELSPGAEQRDLQGALKCSLSL
jgi:DNA-binding MarR family transcriptional regulator